MLVAFVLKCHGTIIRGYRLLAREPIPNQVLGGAGSTADSTTEESQHKLTGKKVYTIRAHYFNSIHQQRGEAKRPCGRRWERLGRVFHLVDIQRQKKERQNRINHIPTRWRHNKEQRTYRAYTNSSNSIHTCGMHHHAGFISSVRFKVQCYGIVRREREGEQRYLPGESWGDSRAYPCSID